MSRVLPAAAGTAGCLLAVMWVAVLAGFWSLVIYALLKFVGAV